MKQSKTISIKCETSETLEIAEMTEMQGGLKERTDIDYDKIKLSICKFGFSFPFFIWKSGKTNYLIDGHGRFATLCKMQKDGYIIPPLPVVYIQCKNKTEAKQKLLRLNSQYGKMTKESVLEFAEDIDLNFDEIALPDTVIDFTEQSGEIAETEGDDEAPEVDEKSEPISKRGEMYELGNSILMCGDSTDAEDVARLMGGEKADMVFTDPPYGYEYQSNMRTKSEKFDVIKNDDKILDFFPMLKDYNKGFIFICTTWKVLNKWIPLFENYYKMSNMIIWNKGGGYIGDLKKTFGTDYELILVANNNAPIIGKRIGSVWSVNKDGNAEYKHPTQKPIALIEMAIDSVSKREDIVLDLFGGSGSTLIACEKTNRKCRIMELDERYCDVIRKRYTKWAKENGKPITSGCLE